MAILVIFRSERYCRQSELTQYLAHLQIYSILLFFQNKNNVHRVDKLVVCRWCCVSVMQIFNKLHFFHYKQGLPTMLSYIFKIMTCSVFSNQALRMNIWINFSSIMYFLILLPFFLYCVYSHTIYSNKRQNTFYKPAFSPSFLKIQLLATLKSTFYKGP